MDNHASHAPVRRHVGQAHCVFCGLHVRQGKRLATCMLCLPNRWQTQIWQVVDKCARMGRLQVGWCMALPTSDCRVLQLLQQAHAHAGASQLEAI